MKKFKRMLAGLACVLAVCLCTPTAFAAKVIIYFDANGGICTSAAERTNADGQLTSLPTATMEGYTFDGWYTDEACTTKWNDGDALTGSMTLYGKWTKNPAAPTTPDAGNKTPDKKLPQTGDTTSAALPALLAGGSLAALGAGIALRRREH